MVVVSVGVGVVVDAALPDGAALGIAAVFPPPPHAARVTQAAAPAIIIRTFSRITARTLARQMTETTQTSRRRPSESRSKEHHVGVGLTFLSALKSGDLDRCVTMLHPEVEWHPTPKLLDHETVRGQERVRDVLETLRDRLAGELEVVPEDGRQVGDHVLLVALLKGVNQFTGQEVKARQCWVISIRDDLWARIVAYPNAPAARLGFEELLGTSPVEKNHPNEQASGVTMSAPMEAAVTPAEEANTQSAAAAKASPEAKAGNTLTLTFTLEEAEALNRWMLKPAQDGSLAADDAAVHPGLMKIRTAVEHSQAITAVRRELEQAGVPTQHLSDQQVAQLGRRISQAAPRLGASG